MSAVFKKEIRTYFTTMSGYVFLGFFVLINAYFFSRFNVGEGSPDYSGTLTYTFSMFLILIPVLTMRLFAEEVRQKTDQLLYTSPISIWKIVFGKFFAAASLFLFGTVIIALFPIILNYYGDVNFIQTFGCFLGYFLLGASLIAVGLFISVLTDNQIIAAVGTFAAVFFILMILYNSTKNIVISGAFFGVCLVAVSVLYFLDDLIFEGIIVRVLNWFSVLNHFESFYMGIFKLSDVVYYISFIYIFLYITINTIEKRRWR